MSNFKRDHPSKKANEAIKNIFSQEVHMKITKGTQSRPQRIVISGVSGIGKSTIASKAPDALFIDTEGSTDQLDVARLPKPETWEQLFDELDFVSVEKPCKTLVIDTIDWAEALCIKHVCQKVKPPKNSIEDFGYGKGYQLVADEFANLLKKLDVVIDSGITVLITAHVQIKKFEQPETLGSFDRYELKLTKKSAPLLSEWADAVLFANYDTKIVERNGKKKAIGGDRIFHTQRANEWDAKNRHGLPEEIPFEFDSIKALFVNTKPKKKEEAVKTDDLPFEFDALPLEEMGAKNIPEALQKAIDEDGRELSYDDIASFVEGKGWRPKGTLIEDYPETLINALVSNIGKISKD